MMRPDGVSGFWGGGCMGTGGRGALLRMVAGIGVVLAVAGGAAASLPGPAQHPPAGPLPLPVHAAGGGAVVSAAGAPGVGAGAAAPGGATVSNDATGRPELVVADPAGTALLIGDSQADGALGVPGSATWPQLALAAAGYTVAFRGRGGIGYTADNGPYLDYVQALQTGQWLLPHGDVGLVVIEGGGNDARVLAGDAAIRASVTALVAELRRSYPRSPLVVIGTLARSADDDGGRRHDVDALIGETAGTLGVPFIPAGDWLTDHGLADRLSDGVHLDAAGHRQAARVLLAELGARGLLRQPQVVAGASPG